MLRELYAMDPVSREFLSRDELLVYLRDDLLEEEVDIREAQELYVTLGVLQRGESLFDLLLSLYGESVLGFFDSEEERLFVVKDAPEFGPRDATTYAHEFVHALQQEHYDIHSRGEKLQDNSDKSRAFRALVEGDARLSEALYMFRYLDEQEIAAAQEPQGDSGTQVLASAPHVIQRLVTFPYFEGTNFVYSLFLTANDWAPVNQAFQDLPLSTEHVLHPEKYQSREPPVAVELPDLAAVLGESWTEIGQDTLGEFLIMSYLETYVTPQRAAIAAAGWGGDAYVLFKGPVDRNLLVWQIIWDDDGEAREFSDTFTDAMEERTESTWEVVEGVEGAQTLGLPGQTVFIQLTADNTLLAIAPDAETLGVVMTALPGN